MFAPLVTGRNPRFHQCHPDQQRILEHKATSESFQASARTTALYVVYIDIARLDLRPNVHSTLARLNASTSSPGTKEERGDEKVPEVHLQDPHHAKGATAMETIAAYENYNLVKPMGLDRMML
ncbi:hypothetical protein CH63R_09210 [Colletotrichum higginsianum IMI 349063]|uniref:Uncharacterized protein n=1 Tax=Colletotrichum higginsianum (strain IMI 349063) TaxID=759273 RepID=A0A1B7Y6R3_COLHI|nr:hypothetical protein CH63R_09210 [Colletotrichum higginsianum IMI 349063]OBR07689.1 hypothetical protein CH63R_09210 [Colletotrichum higginsianum IMI 349063]